MWKSVCCAVQGSGHRKNGIPCQDKTFELTKNDVHVIALSDGAGSAQLSHYGAERTVRTASELIAEHFSQYQSCTDADAVRREIVSVLRRELAEEACTRGCDVRDLACTLLLAAVSGNRFLLLHIGDGVIGYLDGNTLKVASTPDNGEFANETTFVISQNAEKSMRLFKGTLNEKNAFVLMSDGTEQSLYHKRSRTLADIIIDIMQRVCVIRGDVMHRQLAETFTSVVSKRTQDDCSIAILARPGEVLRPVKLLDVEERRRLYCIQRAGARTARRIRRYDTILMFLEEPHCIRQLARKIHLNPRYTGQRLYELEQLGLVERIKNSYRRA